MCILELGKTLTHIWTQTLRLSADLRCNVINFQESYLKERVFNELCQLKEKP